MDGIAYRPGMPRWLSLLAAVATAGGLAGTAPAAAPAPQMVAKPVPFGPARKAQTAAYAKRHYGRASWRLAPKVIVEHYTASDSLASAWATFASNSPDRELGELPGVCAHYLIDRDGTVYALVPTTIACRHTVGLNHRAIGIEHVGRSDASVLGNPRQLRASLALTAWLMQRHGIELGDVIGHNESLESPYREELYGPWRCQTHGDFARAAMDVYRAKLAQRATAAGVPLGRRVHRVRSSC